MAFAGSAAAAGNSITVTVPKHAQFSTTSNWNSGARGIDHACVYLLALGSNAVLDHAFARYRIH